MHKITVTSSKGLVGRKGERESNHSHCDLHIDKRQFTLLKTSRLPFLKNQNEPKTPCQQLPTPQQAEYSYT